MMTKKNVPRDRRVLSCGESGDSIRSRLRRIVTRLVTVAVVVAVVELSLWLMMAVKAIHHSPYIKLNCK
jgi:hypothetical protein